MNPLSLPTDDDYTRAIIGDRIVMKLGRPVVSHPAASPFDWKPAKLQTPPSPPLPIRMLTVVGALVVGVALVYAGMYAANHFGFEGLAVKDELPVGSAKGQSGAVRVIDQDYAPEQSAPIPALAPHQAMPSPLPIDDSHGVPLPINPPPVPGPSGPAKKTEKEATDKPSTSVVVVDDGPAPKAPAPAPAAAAPTKPPEQAHKPASPPKAEVTAKPAPPSATLPPPTKSAKPVEGGGKFATPVEERPVGGTAVKAAAPEAKREEGGVKITIVDIAPGGKTVLVTNPSTRLPTKLGVGDKLPNGNTIQAIDEKTGSVTADGSTYKLD